MTLVLTAKQHDRIKVVTDSRLTFNKDLNLYSDACIKLFSIPVNIYTSVVDDKTKKVTKELFYSNTWCLALAGSYTNGLVLKEITAELLSRLTIKKKENFQLPDICDYILNLFKTTSDSILPILRENGRCILFIAGYDEQMDKVRSFIFRHEIIDGEYQPVYSEVELKSNNIRGFGSGVPTLNKNGQIEHKSIIHAVETVINDEEDNSVGGKIQYGEFNDDNQFEIFGIERITSHKDGRDRTRMNILSIDMVKDLIGKNQNFDLGHSFKRVKD